MRRWGGGGIVLKEYKEGGGKTGWTRGKRGSSESGDQRLSYISYIYTTQNHDEKLLHKKAISHISRIENFPVSSKCYILQHQKLSTEKKGRNPNGGKDFGRFGALCMHDL